MLSGVGVPDLIESSFGVTIDGDEAWVGMFPINVFTRRADDATGVRDVDQNSE